MAFILDNASNNDTLIDGITNQAKLQGIQIKADWVRLRCMPHTVHLAALKVCLFDVDPLCNMVSDDYTAS